MKKSILVLFCLFIAAISFAQQVEVCGILVNKLTKETIAGVQLTIDNKQVTMTDVNGSFSIFLEKGKHTIHFFINSKKQQIDLHIKEAALDLGTIELDINKENHLKHRE